MSTAVNYQWNKERITVNKGIVQQQQIVITGILQEKNKARAASYQQK